jgi:hypothetical protein
MRASMRTEGAQSSSSNDCSRIIFFAVSRILDDATAVTGVSVDRELLLLAIVEKHSNLRPGSEVREQLVKGPALQKSLSLWPRTVG